MSTKLSVIYEFNFLALSTFLCINWVPPTAFTNWLSFDVSLTLAKNLNTMYFWVMFSNFDVFSMSESLFSISWLETSTIILDSRLLASVSNKARCSITWECDNYWLAICLRVCLVSDLRSICSFIRCESSENSIWLDYDWFKPRSLPQSYSYSSSTEAATCEDDSKNSE